MREIKLIDLDEIKSAEVNPKRHDIDSIKQSVVRQGFVELPVVDGRTGRLVAGHGRIESLVSLRDSGAKPPDGVVIQNKKWMAPVVAGWSSKNDAEASAYLVASNRLTELGGWDEAGLSDLLASVAKDGGLLGTGYDSDSLDKLLKSVGVGAEVEMPELATGERETWSTMTFTLSALQVELIKSACDRAGSTPDGSGNENSNGNALANVARAFLAGLS